MSPAPPHEPYEPRQSWLLVHRRGQPFRNAVAPPKSWSCLQGLQTVQQAARERVHPEQGCAVRHRPRVPTSAWSWPPRLLRDDCSLGPPQNRQLLHACRSELRSPKACCAGRQYQMQGGSAGEMLLRCTLLAALQARVRAVTTSSMLASTRLPSGPAAVSRQAGYQVRTDSSLQ